MAAKRSPKKKTTAASPLARVGAAVSAGWARSRPFATPAGWVVFAGVLVAAWVLGVPRLEARASAAAWTDDVAIEFTDLPAWVRGDLLAMLDLTARRQLTGDPFARGDLAAARTALLNTGWFSGVPQVRRVRADHVVVDAVFVRPAAVIRDGDGDHLVDEGGRLLPRTYPHDGAARQLVITGVHYDRPQRPGAQWDGADISAALRLLRLLEDRPWRDQIAAVDVGRYLSEGMLVIRTDLGARILWGHPPGEETALEVEAGLKLAYLDTAFRDFRRIDTGYAGDLHFYEQGYFAE